MAFCNSCGAPLEPAARFCPKCGKGAPVSAAPSTPASAAAVKPAQASSAVKIVLIVVAVIIGLGILGMVTSAFFAWRIAKHTHISSRGDKVRVETPFGTVESTQNSDEAARNIGVDVYPGARALKSSAGAVTFGGMKTAGAEFETSDAPEKVAEFYKQKFPGAMVSTQGDDQYSIVSNEKNRVVTINIESQDGKTRINIANVTGKPSDQSQ